MHLILGGPGSGKTTRLLDIMDQELEAGVPVDRLAFVSFTRQAVNTARQRAMDRFNLPRRRCKYFKTLHALAFYELGLTRSEVFANKHVTKLGEILGMEIHPYMKDTPFAMSEGDKALFLENYARSTGRSLKECWRYMGEQLPWKRLKQFQQTLKEYKKTFGLLDFTDILLEYNKNGFHVPVDVAIIDEAQDLNRAQWDMVWHAFGTAKRIYIAGDDDQAIYKWSGADVEYFLNLDADEKEVLPKSHRLPEEVFNYAKSIIRRVHNRYEKQWSYADHNGKVQFIRDIDHLDLQGSTYYIARNKYLLRQYEEVLRRNGIHYRCQGDNSVDQSHLDLIRNYEAWRSGSEILGKSIRDILASWGRKKHPMEIDHNSYYKPGDVGIDRGDMPIWHDALVGIPLPQRVYYLAMRRRGQKILKEPEVHLDTIHGVKGGEADNVIISTDMTARTYANYQFDSDDEWRVFYVGITRARKNLYIQLPQTTRYYPV